MIVCVPRVHSKDDLCVQRRNDRETLVFNGRCRVAKPQKNRTILARKMVEAGGVEPPSEKARTEENYVRIRLMIFDFHL